MGLGSFVAAARNSCSEIVFGPGLVATGAAAGASVKERPEQWLRLRVWDGNLLWPIDPATLLLNTNAAMQSGGKCNAALHLEEEWAPLISSAQVQPHPLIIKFDGTIVCKS